MSLAPTAQTSPQRIGLLTGGGDCPGLNAVIRAATLTARSECGATVIGIEDGFEGLVEGRTRELRGAHVDSIIGLGGTILGSSNKSDPWHYPVVSAQGAIAIQDVSARVLEGLARAGIDTLIAIGGDGTMHIGKRLGELGVKVIGVPKTIDNDLAATDVTFGYDTAVSIVAEAIDRLSTTASSHHRVMVIEVMGRYAGWIAAAGGLAGGADVILIPEIPFNWDAVCRKVEQRNAHGMRYSIVCVAEGATTPDGGQVVRELDIKRTDATRLGGIGEVVAAEIAARTGLETRANVLGHMQRGGTPTAFDRILATRFGAAAVHLACKGEHGLMVALRDSEIVSVPIADAIATRRVVPVTHGLIASARAIGIAFGDEKI